MPKEFPNSRWKWTPLIAIGGALGTAGLLFLLIPLTQLLDKVEQPDLEVREVTFSPPPPELPPPPPDEMEPPEAEEPPPEMPKEPPPIEIDALDVALNPGAGDAVAMGIPTPDLNMEQDMTGDIQKLFTFEDLSESPRLINQPRFRYPSRLARRGIDEGKVIVEIDILPNGRAELRRIISSTHPELEEAAREIVRSARFTKPEVNGRPQTVRGRFPLILQN
ncbi:energy transducer TonB [Coraliomargarita sinensis]|uniref:energy transducer TonB n=1 Tax=Coraliomargarita sinensis TaxID=2174842 RepID=UPI001304B578|nr:energy transducer TonB [Coraliomargarita sinensis]